MLYALASFHADHVYTAGGNGNLDLSQLQQAAHDFPLNHDYRLGPARLIVHDHIWWKPKDALPILEAVQKNDPYSHFLAWWIAQYIREASGK